jgi:hypothetical protein
MNATLVASERELLNDLMQRHLRRPKAENFMPGPTTYVTAACPALCDTSVLGSRRQWKRCMR